MTTVELPQSHLRENPFELAQQQLQRVADTFGIDQNIINVLRQCKKATAVFEAFSYSHRKEYIEWIAEAKRDETRDARVKQAIEWMAEGKSRHWKYTANPA